MNIFTKAVKKYCDVCGWKYDTFILECKIVLALIAYVLFVGSFF